MICKILSTFNNIDLRPMQVDVKFVRNRTNNLLNKSQAASNLKQTELFAPEDIITLIGVTENSKEMAQRGEDYWDAKHAEEAKRQAVKTPTPADTPANTGQEVENAT